MTSNWDRYASGRRAHLPPDWAKIRRKVLRRDNHTCQIQDPGVCTTVADEVDHMIGRDDHRMTSLQAVCAPCHKRKTQGESTRSQNARRERISKSFSRVEEHPGNI